MEAINQGSNVKESIQCTHNIEEKRKLSLMRDFLEFRDPSVKVLNSYSFHFLEKNDYFQISMHI